MLFPRSTRLHSQWLLVVVTAWSVSGAASNSMLPMRPTLRIAHLVAWNEFDSPVQLTLGNVQNAANRSILPDFDVIVDTVRFESLTGNVAKKLVEILLAEEPYHAILGPAATIDCTYTVDLTEQARVLQIIKGDNVEYSQQRERYPYVFRTIRSVIGLLNTWMYMLASNGWLSVLSIWVEGPSVDLANQLAATYGISNYGVLAEVGADVEEWQREAWQNAALGWILAERLRVVMMYDLQIIEDQYQFTCRVHRSMISGIQYFTWGYHPADWFLRTYPPELGQCSVEEMFIAVEGYIYATHTPTPPGLQLGAHQLPVLDGIDQSKLQLTCMPDLVVTDFYIQLLFDNSLPFISGGAIIDNNAAERYLSLAGSDSDMLCAVLLALHDSIYKKGVQVTAIAQRQEEAFRALADSVSLVDFQGVQGAMRFYPNSSDPVVIYYVIGQLGLRGALHNTSINTAVVEYPDGQTAAPVIHILDENRPFRWRDGGTGLGQHNAHLGLFPSCGDSNAVLVWDSCEPCPPGRAYDALVSQCRTCPLGDYQEEAGQSECRSALPGTFINDTLQPTNAALCPMGNECPQVGTVQPQGCPPGRFANTSGLAECKLCPRGSYQEGIGATTCNDCSQILEGSTTRDIASTSSSQCICSAGFFRPLDVVRCMPCLEGMVCPEGSDMRNLRGEPLEIAPAGPYPLVDIGYMSLIEEPLTIYLCRAKEHCPGGPPASCAELRDATLVACGRCLPDAYKSGEACKACGDAGILPIVLASLACIFVVVAITFVLNMDTRATPTASLTVVLMTGMLFTSLQTLGLFNQIAIPWVEPVKGLFSVFAFFSFDLEILRLSCVVGTDNVRSYAFRQMVPISLPPIVGCALVLKWARVGAGQFAGGRVYGERKIPVDAIAAQALNAIGALFSLFFTSIVISMLTPLLCYRHPGSSGESVLLASSVLCFESTEHTSMLVISVLALFIVVVPFLAMVGYGILAYPTNVARSDNLLFLQSFRFLFARYNPKHYYFQCILLGRSLLLCLTPAVFRGQPPAQVLFMCIILGCYTVIIARVAAWRSPLCNLVDAAMNAMMSVMLTCGALFLEDKLHKDTLGVFSAVILALLLGLVLTGIGIGLRRRFTPRPFYDFFICHHKAQAAAQARLLKILLQAGRQRLQVFVDSDDLKELDTLFDTVRSKLRHLVVYLTAETLRRPWCTGEVVSATWAKICITRVQTPSFLPVPEDKLKDPESYVDSLGCNLTEYGIQWSHVTEAYRALFSQTKVLELNATALGSARFEQLAASLLSQRTDPKDVQSLRQVGPSKFILAADRDNDEASAAAAVLVAALSEPIFEFCSERICVLSDFMLDMVAAQALVRQATAVIMLLTGGFLETEECLRVVCEVQVRKTGSQSPNMAAAAIPVNAPDFVFPSAMFFAKLQKTLRPVFDEYGEDVALECLHSFFKHIAIFYPTHASQQVLDIQSEEVLRRVRLADSAAASRADRGGRRTSMSSAGSAASAHSRAVSTGSRASQVRSNNALVDNEASPEKASEEQDVQCSMREYTLEDLKLLEV